MTETTDIATSTSVTYQGDAVAASPGGTGGLTFGEVLSDLNPLQYLPIVGTIYRAVTGDTIPQPLREAGSLAVSGVLGGPVGVATNLAILAFEKLTGVDLEDVEQSVLAAVFPAPKSAPGIAVARAAAAGAPSAGAPSVAAAARPVAPGLAADPAPGRPWTPAQLAAYGVVQLPNGDLRQGELTGADVLNALQLRASTGALAAA
jgi:hypothetical protein